MGSLQIVFGENVRKYRTKLKYTQAQLSELIDVSPSFVGYIENGKAYPSFKTIELLAIALKVHPGKLFDDTLTTGNDSDVSVYNPGVARVVHDLGLIIEKYKAEAVIPEKKNHRKSK